MARLVAVYDLRGMNCPLPVLKARKRLGNAQHPPIEPAPGRYVKVRADAVPGAD